MRVFGHHVPGARVRLFVAEQAAAGVLFLAALASAGVHGASAIAVAALSVLGLQGALYLSDLYGVQEGFPPARWMVAAGLGTLAASAVWAVTGPRQPGIWFLALALAVVVLVLLRALPLGRPRRVVVLGTGEPARRVAELLENEAAADCVPCAYVALDEATGRSFSPSPLLLARGEPADRIVERARADVLVVATDQAPDEETLARVRASGVEVLSAAGFVARHARRLPPELLGPGELAFGEGFQASRRFETAQRIVDVLAASVLLILASPVLLAAILAVRLDSKGPVFYSQERVGKNGRTFLVTKLRTMRVDAEADGRPVWALQNDNRITRVGRLLRKTRIDEIPQLLAVLQGDMAMVGPRPERPFFVEQLKEQIPCFGLREAVKPGVTGWAQILYPYGATVEDAKNKLEFDLYYVRHRSVFLDLSVLFHTARTVLTARGAR